MPRRAVSRAQARFLGAIAGGRLHKRGLSRAKAKEMLRGTKIKSLPPRKGVRRRVG